MGAKTRKHKTFQVRVRLGEVSSRDLGWGGAGFLQQGDNRGSTPGRVLRRREIKTGYHKPCL